MASSVEDITIAFTENGILKVKELAKSILTRGAWTTIMFKYQDLDAKSGEYGPIKYSIRRYQKKNNEYRAKSKFNISNREQAEKIIQVLSNWFES